MHGVDIGATETIHRALLEERARGAAILLISEDLDELFELSDRIGVLYSGKLMGVFARKDASYARLGALMSGAASAEEQCQ